MGIDVSQARTVYFGAQGMFYGEDAGEVPVPSDMPGVAGIYLGGCIERGTGRISERTKCEAAHAHIRGVYKGWVCFQMPQYFYEAEYHWLRMHELAHIMSGQGHTEAWRSALRSLGEEIPSKYRPRKRLKKQ